MDNVELESKNERLVAEVVLLKENDARLRKKANEWRKNLALLDHKLGVCNSRLVSRSITDMQAANARESDVTEAMLDDIYQDDLTTRGPGYYMGDCLVHPSQKYEYSDVTSLPSSTEHKGRPSE